MTTFEHLPESRQNAWLYDAVYKLQTRVQELEARAARPIASKIKNRKPSSKASEPTMKALKALLK